MSFKSSLPWDLEQAMTAFQVNQNWYEEYWLRDTNDGKWSVRLANSPSQGDFWPAETHRDPSGDKPRHELAGVTIIIR